MQADLERLIRLQDLDTAAAHAARQIAETPERVRALDLRLADHERPVDEAKGRLADNHAARRETEKKLASVQTRLSKFKDQLMAVKTNKEYQAMQKEMATAEEEIREFEDLLLEGMLQADELEQLMAAAEQALAAEKTLVLQERTELEREQQALAKELERTNGERNALVKEIDPSVVTLFEGIAHVRGGIALTEARDGLCNVCHVRLRPQVYNEVQKQDALHRCENCQRILYFVSAGAGSGPAPA